MAYSTCPKCEGHQFEMVENSPSKSNYIIMFIQCASCGTVVGTADYLDIPTLLQKIATKMGFKL